MFERKLPGMVYLAIPYNGQYRPELCPKIQHEASFQRANLVTALLIESGEVVYSPITHSHPLVGHMQKYGQDHQFWMEYDECMMAMCDRMYVIEGEGWQLSRGVFREVDWFLKRGLPISILRLLEDNVTLHKIRYERVYQGMEPWVGEQDGFDPDLIIGDIVEFDDIRYAKAATAMYLNDKKVQKKKKDARQLNIFDSVSRR